MKITTQLVLFMMCFSVFFAILFSLIFTVIFLYLVRSRAKNHNIMIFPTNHPDVYRIDLDVIDNNKFNHLNHLEGEMRDALRFDENYNEVAPDSWDEDEEETENETEN